jgi:allophanate hydrolase
MVPDSANQEPAGRQASAFDARAWLCRPAAPVVAAVEGDAAAQGVLGGLRFAVKDNIDVAGLPTTAGCPAFAYTAARHATVVQRLLDAGASLVGKTHLDQFACGLNGSRSPDGALPSSFSADHVCGGSSSGSAYVVATGQVDFALGTDTAGSGRVPAAFNNIVGLKPTRGLVSAHGVVPAAQSIDCVSIFAPTVATAWKVLAACAAHDRADPYARAVDIDPRPFPAKFRFGIPQPLEFFGDRLAEAAFAASTRRLHELGGVPVPVDFEPFASAAELLYESALVAERHAAIRGFFDRHEDRVIEPVRSIIAGGRLYSASDYVAAQTRLRTLAQRIEPVWQAIDLLVVPSAPLFPRLDAIAADPIGLNRRLGHYTNFVNLLDLAALAVPGPPRGDGLPAGITLIAPAGGDFRLAQLGQRFHHAAGQTCGATGMALPEPEPLDARVGAAGAWHRLAVVGAHLSGLPLNGQLLERGARLVERTRTAPHYRLYALPGTAPPKPGLVRVQAGEGVPIAVEVWELPLAHFGSFVAGVPAPLAIGTLTLEDGRSVQGFVCEAAASAGALDISAHGGWRAWLASSPLDSTSRARGSAAHHP